MKKIVLFIIVCTNFVFSQQNLIPNPGFENGSQIMAYYLYGTFANSGIANIGSSQVPNWRKGCSTTSQGVPGNPQLFEVNYAYPNSQTNYYGIPVNIWTDNTPMNPLSPLGSKRYVGLSSNMSLLGETSGPLTAGAYTVSFFHRRPNSYYYPGFGNIEVVLRSSSNPCSSSGLIVYSSNQSPIDYWESSSGNFTISQSQSMLYDRIEFRVNSTIATAVFVDDFSLIKRNLNPQISGNSSFCAGTPLTFTGSIASGTNSQSHLWEIQECTSTGSVIGGILYGQWFTGNPSTFTFPSSLNLPCNKHYRVKLAPSNNVPGEWFETTKIIYLKCLPTITPSQTQTICSGNSISFNSNQFPISVTANGIQVGVYNSNPIILAPTITTTYTFTPVVKSPCSVSRTVQVQNCPTPCFSFNTILSMQNEPSFYGPQSVKTICLPNVTINGSCSTNENGYHLRIAEFNLATWEFEPDLYNNWVSTTGTVPSNVNLSNLVLPNTFDPNKIYLVGLTVGNGWYSAPPQFFRVTSCLPKNINTEDNDVSQELSNVKISPNPTTNLINFTFDKNETGEIEIYSLDGKLVFAKDFKEKSIIEVNLSEYSNGIYIAKITANGHTVTKKIVKE